MLEHDLASGDAADEFGMILLSVLLLAISALPQFLHWWKAR